MLFKELFKHPKPLIGMIHLPPLPGYARCPGMTGLFRHVEEEIDLLQRLGYDGVLLENEHDRPHNVKSAPETTAAMAVLVRHAVEHARSIVVGAEILLNDPCASLAAAYAGGARFIRTDYFVDRMERAEYGEMMIDPEGLMAYRSALGAQQIAVFADIQVKYARMIEARAIGDSAILAREKGADAVIVSGNCTGFAPDANDLTLAAEAARDFPVLIGSGLNVENAQVLLGPASGAIVGTGIMSNGRINSEKASMLKAIRDEIIG